MSETRMVWRVRPKEGGPWLMAENMVDLGQQLADMVGDAAAFDLECVEMTEREIEEIGEFDGW